MEAARPDDDTVCPRCGTRHTIGDLEPYVKVLCGRCDALLGGPTGGPGSFDTFASQQVVTRWSYGRGVRPPPGPDAPGQPVRKVGRYAIRAELGRGGMGVVYRAWDGDLGREVALKVLLTGMHSAHVQVERFLREARAAAKLDHPNLVRVHDIGFATDHAYFTMDLVEGPSLQEVVGARGRLPVPEAVRIAAALARALGSAHQRGLVHRDVKPANVLLRPDGTPLLADFGLATQATDTRITRSGELMGTPAYMAPEQTHGPGRVGPLADQYALGAVLYEMLCGTAPYLDQNPAELLYALIAGPPQAIRERLPDVPRDLAVIVEMAMAREPERRYATAVAFAEDLERTLVGEAIRARPPSVAYRVRWAILRNRGWLGLGATALVAAVLAAQGGSLARAWRDARIEEQREAEARQELAHLRDGLAGASPAEARARLVAFADDPARAGTACAVQALFDAARLVHDDDLDAGIDAWAAAYAAARTGADQATALRGVAGRFRAAWRWDALTVVLDTLVDRNPALASDPELAVWRAEALLGLRRPGEARPALGALAGGRPAPELDGDVFREADTDGDGGAEWWVASGRTLVARRAAPGLPVAGRWELPPGPWAEGELQVVAHEPRVVLARRVPETGAEVVVLEVRGDALVEAYAWPEARLASAAATDLDRDGRREVYVGIGPYARHLVRLDRSPDGHWTRSPGDPELDAAASDVTALAAADLDGDGWDELVVAAGAWHAYDLRVLRGGPRGVERIARRKLGYVPALRVADGALWVAKSDEYPSRVVFPPDRAFGEAPGAWLLSVRDLGTERFLARPGPRQGALAPVGALVVADLDGDGADEVVLGLPGERPATAVWRGGEEGPLVLGGVLALAAADVDGDAPAELLVEVDGHTTWILGAGDAPLPPLPSGVPERAALPDLPDPIAARTWARAEDLVGMGLVDRAVEVLVNLADGAEEDRDLAAAAHRRAAALAEGLGDDLRAAELYEAAGDRGAAARQHVRAHRFEDALPARPDLEPLARATRSVAIPLRRGVLDPLAARGDASGGLRVTAWGDGGPIARVPFRWSEGRLGLRVELDLKRVEWGGGVRVALVGPDAELGFEVRGWGGGNMLEREVACVVGGEDALATRARVDGPAGDVPVVLELDVVTGDGRCALTVGDETVHGHVDLAAMPAAGDWALVVSPSRHAGAELPSAAVAVVRSATVVGTDLALVEDGAPPADPRRAAVWAAIALAEAGRWDDAVGAAGTLSTSDPVVAVEVRHGLRGHLATFGPVLRRAWGDSYWQAFQEAWEVAAHHHPDDPEVVRAFTTGLAGLFETRGSDARMALLLLARGRAWARLGEPAAARRDLSEAARILEPQVARLSGEAARDARSKLAAGWIDLAELAARGGDEDGAREAIARALAVAEAPELAADQVRAREVLAPLAP